MPALWSLLKRTASEIWTLWRRFSDFSFIWGAIRKQAFWGFLRPGITGVQGRFGAGAVSLSFIVSVFVLSSLGDGVL